MRHAVLALALVLPAVLAGCQGSGPTALPQWAPDEVPTWEDGEAWGYALDGWGVLNVTVLDAQAERDGAPRILAQWQWSGHRAGTGRSTWQIWHDPDDLSWARVDVVRPDGSAITSRDNSRCPVLALFPPGPRSEPCLEPGPFGDIESTIHRRDEGPRAVTTALGVLQGRHYRYSSEFGEPFNGTYAPAVGNWAELTMNVPGDFHETDGVLHTLSWYHNPRTGDTLGDQNSTAPVTR